MGVGVEKNEIKTIGDIAGKAKKGKEGGKGEEEKRYKLRKREKSLNRTEGEER